MHKKEFCILTNKCGNKFNPLSASALPLAIVSSQRVKDFA